MNQESHSYLAESTDARRLLSVYRSFSENGPSIWHPRQYAVEGIEASVLSSLHGKLIAYGYLEVDVSDLSVGIRYQVSTLGRQGLDAACNAAVEASSDEAAFADGTASPPELEAAPSGPADGVP